MYLNIIIVNGILYGSFTQILYLYQHVSDINARDRFSCISTLIDPFIIIWVCHSNWISYTSAWELITRSFFPTMAFVYRECGLLDFVLCCMILFLI